MEKRNHIWRCLRVDSPSFLSISRTRIHPLSTNHRMCRSISWALSCCASDGLLKYIVCLWLRCPAQQWVPLRMEALLLSHSPYFWTMCAYFPNIRRHWHWETRTYKVRRFGFHNIRRLCGVWPNDYGWNMACYGHRQNILRLNIEIVCNGWNMCWNGSIQLNEELYLSFRVFSCYLSPRSYHRRQPGQQLKFILEYDRKRLEFLFLFFTPKSIAKAQPVEWAR